MKPVRVLVVDDSSFNRKVISEMLESREGIEVIGTAFDGEDAIGKILKYKPDVITLDLEMPRMDGFTALRWIMANQPVPVIVVSSRESDRSVFKALDFGALDFVVKPSRAASPKLKEMKNELLAKILSVPSLRFKRLQERTNEKPPEPPPDPLPLAMGDRTAEVIALAASTGGPPAVQSILMGLYGNIISPVVICQHMPPVFTRLFAERLATLSGRPVKEAEDGERLTTGMTYVAPGGKQLRITGSRKQKTLTVSDKAPGDRFAPSADILLNSMVDSCGSNCLAAVLTGMGNDGTAGAKALHKKGAIVLAESRESAVIFGMPREVIKAGAADRVEDIRGIIRLINLHAVLKG